MVRKAVAKKQDKSTRLIYQRLKERFPKLSEEIESVVYRYNPAAIRVRIVDSSFAGKGLHEREFIIDDVLESLPADVRGDITLLLLMTPRELKEKSDLMSREFDIPDGTFL